ncbi:hypothetical protein BBJ41_10220 [Burkholderia stabilis]|nr:hypothetical protein BBJ41_10220 [Burkholderia stabilis]
MNNLASISVVTGICEYLPKSMLPFYEALYFYDGRWEKQIDVADRSVNFGLSGRVSYRQYVSHRAFKATVLRDVFEVSLGNFGCGEVVAMLMACFAV